MMETKSLSVYVNGKNIGTSPRLDADARRKAKAAEIDAGIAALVRGALKGR